MKRQNYLGWLLLPALAAQGQYVGKVEAAKKPVLRAVAVYEYTGAPAKPNASRLVPVVVWDGERYQPGGLYLARPEPLAVAPGTQYVLEKSGEPEGLFDVSSAAQLGSGGWVGLGRFQAETPKPAPKLLASKTLPVVKGGSGRGKAGAETSSDNGGPVLHRKAGSDTGSGSDTNGSGPTLHRRDTDTTAPQSNGTGGTSTGSSGGDQPTLHRRDTDAGAAPAPDPDRPTLHRAGADPASGSAAPDRDRPTLHRHADMGAATVSAPDPDRPHLRYGATADEGRVEPALLSDKPATPGANAAPVPVGEAVAVSDTVAEEAHPFRYAWPSPQAQADAEEALRALALRALANAAKATFGPAAKSDAALRKAAGAAGASFGPGAKSRAGRKASAAATDPMVDPQFTAWELSYGGGATFVYSAHTTGTDPRYVTVIAQPDFYGKPQVVFSQTTRGELLDQTPALHLIDAVDADGDNRAELLFSRQSAESMRNPAAARQFALYGVEGGKVKLLYASEAGVAQ